MRTAQRLYEEGHITYMRTDSVTLSNEALSASRSAIEKLYGKEFIPEKPKLYKSKVKNAQEAHEAIRPTNFEKFEVQMDSDQTRLYKLIWLRTIASQMSDALLERTIFKIKSNAYQNEFSSKGEVVKFDGFLKVYIASVEDTEDEENANILPELAVGESLRNIKMAATQKFSSPPFRFTEGTLVKKLEELGIGRPSTYAPTITTIQNRKYVSKGNFEGEKRMYTELHLTSNNIETIKSKEIIGSDKGKLVPTEVGTIVTDFLVNNFNNILDYNFTASVEQDFDKIANGEKEWTSILKDFYGSFHLNVEDVKENASRETGERILGNDPKSGRKVIVRLGKFGPMVQIGTVEDEEKPIFAGLLPHQKIGKITLEESLELFKLPCYLGDLKMKK